MPVLACYIMLHTILGALSQFVDAVAVSLVPAYCEGYPETYASIAANPRSGTTKCPAQLTAKFLEPYA